MITNIILGIIAFCALMAIISFIKERPLRKRARADMKRIAEKVRKCDHKTCYLRFAIVTYPFLMKQIRRDPDYEEHFEQFLEHM